MSGSHKKKASESQFCAVRSSKRSECGCGNNHFDNCAPSEDWGKYPERYTRKVKDKHTDELVAKYLTARKISHNAHHIACVASVASIVAKDEAILPVVQNTKWCINAKANMIALPKWPHTILWYCDLSRASPLRPEILEESAHGNYVMSSAAEPPFADRPQHDYDHGAYQREVDRALNDIVLELKEVDGHKDQDETLKSELDSLVDHFESELIRRGRRVGGTHAAWNKGMNFRDSDWYMPFSMAADNDAEARTFPLRDMTDGGKLANKILDVATAYWLEGQKIPLPI